MYLTGAVKKSRLDFGDGKIDQTPNRLHDYQAVLV